MMILQCSNKWPNNSGYKQLAEQFSGLIAAFLVAGMCLKNYSFIALNISQVTTDLSVNSCSFLGSNCSVATQEQSFGVMTDGFMSALGQG